RPCGTGQGGFAGQGKNEPHAALGWGAAAHRNCPCCGQSAQDPAGRRAYWESGSRTGRRNHEPFRAVQPHWRQHADCEPRPLADRTTATPDSDPGQRQTDQGRHFPHETDEARHTLKKRSPDMRSGARTQQVTLKSGLQSRWQNHLDVAGSSLRKLVVAPFSTAMTVAVIAIALLLPSALFVAMDNLSALSEGFGRLARITLYLEDNLSELESSALRERLLSRRDIAAVEYISPAQGAEEFARYSGLGDVLALLEDNPLPGVLLVTPADSGAQSPTLLGELAGMDGVSLAQLDLQWIERLRLLLETAGRVSTALMLVFALAVLLVIGNTIRLAIESRRAEIVVVKLVGGTDGYVARPFLYTGMWYGL